MHLNIFITIALILIIGLFLWVIVILIIDSIERKNIDRKRNTFKELYDSMTMMDRIRKELENGGRR